MIETIIYMLVVNSMDFNDIDFKGGNVNTIEKLGQDMLEVFYPSGYMIDVGYVERLNTFYVTVVKNDDWANIIKELPAKTEVELKQNLRFAIDFVVSMGG